METKHSIADGHLTVVVLTTPADREKARTVGDRVPEHCLGNPDYRMITIIRFARRHTVLGKDRYPRSSGTASTKKQNGFKPDTTERRLHVMRGKTFSLRPTLTDRCRHSLASRGSNGFLRFRVRTKWRINSSMAWSPKCRTIGCRGKVMALTPCFSAVRNTTVRLNRLNDLPLESKESR